MNYTLRPFTNEMWATLEEEQFSSSSRSLATCHLSRSPHEAEDEDKTQTELKSPRPITPKSRLGIGPQHLDDLQTLGTIATFSTGSLSRLTGHVSKRKMEKAREQVSPERKDDDNEEEEKEEEEHGSSDSLRSPHHTRSPRSYATHRAQRKRQREVVPRASASRAHPDRYREVESPPARNLRRRPSPPAPVASSSSYLSLSRGNSIPSSHSQQSQSQSISGTGPSTSTLPSDHRQDNIVNPQTRGSRRAVLDVSSERVLSSLRVQLEESQFSRYTMPHPKRDGPVPGKKWRCAYELETGNRCHVAFSRKGEARRHAFTHEIHLRWICPSLADDASACGKLFARQDAATRHLEQSKPCKDLAANRSEGFPILVWEEEDETVAEIVTLAWTEDDDNEGNE